MKDPYENMTPDERRLAAQASADAFEKDRVPLMIVGALVVLTTVLVFASRATGIGQQHVRERDVVASVEMRVVDAPEGVIEFINPDTNDLIWSVAPGEYGFVRTAVRALAFRREIVGADAFSPIVLQKTAKDRLILSDPTTGQSIEINAFGDGNVSQFHPMLAAAQ